MTVRKDGEETRHRILDAACRVFGEKGYRDATNAEICERAGVNSAAINYHFRSKAELYRKTWEYTSARIEESYPLSAAANADAPPHERLRAHIRTHLALIMDEELRHFHRMRMREVFSPTGLVDDLMLGWVSEARAVTREILVELLGDAATEENIRLCEMSVIAQGRMLMRSPKRRRNLPWLFNRSDIDLLVDHITRFSLAGIQAVRKRGAAANNGQTAGEE